MASRTMFQAPPNIPARVEMAMSWERSCSTAQPIAQVTSFARGDASVADVAERRRLADVLPTPVVDSFAPRHAHRHPDRTGGVNAAPLVLEASTSTQCAQHAFRYVPMCLPALAHQRKAAYPADYPDVAHHADPETGRHESSVTLCPLDERTSSSGLRRALLCQDSDRFRLVGLFSHGGQVDDAVGAFGLVPTDLLTLERLDQRSIEQVGPQRLVDETVDGNDH